MIDVSKPIPLAEESKGVAPALISPAPALALAERWASELAVLQRRSPASDAATTLADCLKELGDALRAGRDTRLHITIAEAHSQSGIPVSTLRWLCKHKPHFVGARKHEGVWYIDRGQFQRYVSGSDGAKRGGTSGEAAEAA